jgi:uncharacterized membrane protein
MVDHVLWAAVVFLALHALPSTPLRATLVRSLGVGGYRALFSVLSAAALLWLIFEYRDAPVEPVWNSGAWANWLAILGMPVAFLLFVGGLTSRNPMVAGMERIAGGDGHPAPGFLSITRHPLFWSFALWGVLHLIARGDLASIYFFGSLTLLSLVGMTLIDRRKSEELGRAYGPFLMRTSAVPFAAVLEGRTRIDWQGIGWWRPALALLLYVLFLGGHPHIFGVSPLPA